MDIAPSETRPIEDEQLIAWAVQAGGRHVTMDFIGTDGTHHKIVLPFDASTGWLMTLPHMLQTALDARFSDGSLRFVQLLCSWQIEQAEVGDGLILRRRTRDGFEVAFSLNNRDADTLGAALEAALDMEQSKTRRPN